MKMSGGEGGTMVYEVVEESDVPAHEWHVRNKVGKKKKRKRH